MHVVFRADASLTIGNGHVMRCASLGHALRAQGAHCSFVCMAELGHLNNYLEAQGFAVHTLPSRIRDTRTCAEDLLPDWRNDALNTQQVLTQQAIDWLVVDHYGLDRQWEDMLSTHTKRLMVIDDLANRAHQCALLLDANPGRHADDYASLTPARNRLLVGPWYALIRDEIRQNRNTTSEHHGPSSTLKVLVTLGGVDKDNIACQVLAALNTFEGDRPLAIQVIIGPFAPWKTQVIETARAMRWPTQVIHNPDDFVKRMCAHDLAIGAAGTSALERCCLGLPSINVVLAPNQYLSAKALQAQQAAGLIELTSGWQTALHMQLRHLQHDASRQTMRDICTRITDGAGCERVTGEMAHA